MTPEFQRYEPTFGAELLCPSCGHSNLHHDKVEVFECGEDATYGLHVTVKDAQTTVDTDLKGNPSSRRHGLEITFWCESCDAKPVLRLLQHKGSTYVDFS